MSDYTEALFVSTVLYRETVPADVQETFATAEDPWAVRIEADIPSSRQAVHYCIDTDPLPIREEEPKSQELPEDLGFTTAGGTRISFVEVKINLPPNAQFLPYPSMEDLYAIRVAWTFGA